MKTVEIWLMETSEPIIKEGVKNTYTKGPLFCVMMADGGVFKFPVEHIFFVYEPPITKK